MEQIRTIKLGSPARLILPIGFGMLYLVFVFFTVKWFFGNAVATRVFQKEVAEFAVSLAPDDPQTHLSAGILYEQTLQPEDLPKALAEYEKAVALSPNDYRLWLAYGKAKERNGDRIGAEKALFRALELAPNYADVRWVYGNILLRAGKNAEAFAEIKRAVAGDPKYAGPAAATAWDIFQGDLAAVRKNIGDSAPVQVALVTLLINQKRFDDALEIWDGISSGEKKTVFRKDGENIFKILVGDKKYRQALAVLSQAARNESEKRYVGRVTDGGFEGIINTQEAKIFEWEIAPGNEPRIGVSVEQKTQGEKSLTLVFNSAVGKEFRKVAQTVAVEGGKDYEFEAFYRSELETSATMKWEIVDTETGEVLASTDAIEKKSDWKSLKTAFTTPEESEGIIIRLVRQECTSADCSIEGTVWFDQISITDN